VKNKGEAGYGHADDPGPDRCRIRDLEIENPFYTYCANHPHRNPDRIEAPLGPVFTGDSFGDREPWVDAPDTEEVRETLLGLLSRVAEVPREEYPIGIYLDEIVILELGRLRERRAVERLERIAEFDTETTHGPFERSRASTVRAARLALARIRGA
jgi:hypothetical protein